jgi:adenylate cyclase
MGDGFMASFTSASGALDAAIAMQQSISAHFDTTSTPVRIRVGVNAGEPIEEDDDLYGTAVIQAARVMGLADGGQILVTDTVRNLVAGKPYLFSDHGSHDLKGFEELARLFQVGWADREE